MFFHACKIIMTALAIFGGYCFLDMLYTVLLLSRLPRSVTILKYSEDSYTRRKVEFMQSTLYNNSVIFISDDNTNIFPDTQIMDKIALYKYIDKVIFTN